MNTEHEKCVMVLDESLSGGLIANTAAILGITLGRRLPEVVGEDAADLEGRAHAGIIRFPVPVLRGNAEIIREIRQKLFTPRFSDLTAVDFSDLAQGCRSYDEYLEKMAACPEKDLRYMGLAICGDSKQVNRLTGNLPLLR